MFRVNKIAFGHKENKQRQQQHRQQQVTTTTNNNNNSISWHSHDDYSKTTNTTCFLFIISFVKHVWSKLFFLSFSLSSSSLYIERVHGDIHNITYVVLLLLLLLLLPK